MKAYINFLPLFLLILPSCTSYSPLKLLISYDLSTPSHLATFKNRSRRTKKNTNNTHLQQLKYNHSYDGAWVVVEDILLSRMAKLSGLKDWSPRGTINWGAQDNWGAQGGNDVDVRVEETMGCIGESGVFLSTSTEHGYLPMLVPPPGVKCSVNWHHSHADGDSGPSGGRDSKGLRGVGGGDKVGETIRDKSTVDPSSFQAFQDLELFKFKINRMLPSYVRVREAEFGALEEEGVVKLGWNLILPSVGTVHEPAREEVFAGRYASRCEWGEVRTGGEGGGGSG